MSNFFLQWKHKWAALLRDRAYRISLVAGLILLTSAYFVNYFASTYNDGNDYISVGDLLLDNIPTYNMEFFFTWVMYGIMALIFIYPTFVKPEIAPFGLKTYAVLMFLRCGTILLTHVGPPEGFYYAGVEVGGDAFSNILFKNDLFFSGHTAYPFLGFLIFRDHWIRWILFGGSILMAVTVLLMHVHYSIDVIAAFFITYGTYTLSERIFKKLIVRFRRKIKFALKRLKRTSKLKFKKLTKNTYGSSKN